jgi:hypothetical protein
VAREEGSRQRGSGLDGCKQFGSYYIKEKFENKGSQTGHTKKKKILLHINFFWFFNFT